MKFTRLQSSMISSALAVALAGSPRFNPIVRAENPETIAAQIKAELGKITDQMKGITGKVDSEVRASQEISQETRKEVDKLLKAHNELVQQLSGIEQIIAKLEGASGGDEQHSTPGMIFTQSADFKAIAESGSKWKGNVVVPVRNATLVREITNGNLVAPQRVGMLAPAQQRLTIRDLIAPGNTTSNSIEFIRETGFTNNAAPVSENPSGLKPESSLTFEQDSAPVVTIAHWLRASKQVLTDVNMMQSYIDGRLMYGLDLKVEDQLLNGAGTGNNIDGLINQATAFVDPGVVVSNETRIDRLRIAMLQVALAEYQADGIVLNPIDWTSIELTKDSTNAYLFTSPTVDGNPTLWGLPVIATTAMSLGDYLVGAFRMAAQVWDRQSATISVSNQDRDNFVKNLVTILCETELALTVYRPEALVKGDFASL
jgi:HK97 family phage major capsid protein